MLFGMPTALSLARSFDGRDAGAQRGARRKIERHRGGRKLRQVIDQQRAVFRTSTLAIADNGTWPPPADGT